MGNHLETRMARIEAEMDRQHPVSHHRVVVHVPIDVDVDDYLRELPCLCGAGAWCPEKSHGLIVPATLTAAAWQHQAQQFYAERPAHV